jgi:hypothetical protein
MFLWTGFHVFRITQFTFSTQYYRSITNSVYLRCESQILVALVNVNIKIITHRGAVSSPDDNNFDTSHLILFLIGSECLFHILRWLNYMYEDRILSTPVERITSHTKALEYLVFLNRALQNSSEEKNQLLIFGILKYNYLFLKSECPSIDQILANYSH